MPDFPVIPGYRIEKELGQGGMATVYLAVQERLNRRVAIKVLSLLLLQDQNFARRFLKEAETAANLAHPSIVTIFDVGDSGGNFHIIMEYLGESLKDRILRRELEPQASLRIVEQIAGALDYAHAKGFVHRDIKPENILFRADGTPVLVDFGIAKAMDAATKLTKTGISIGTPYYMSPEQGRGEVIDGRSDYYSLGVVLYEMLTGKVPYDAENTVGIVIKHIQEPVPLLPEKLIEYQMILNRMLAKNKEARIGSLEAFRGLSSTGIATSNNEAPESIFRASNPSLKSDKRIDYSEDLDIKKSSLIQHSREINFIADPNDEKIKIGHNFKEIPNEPIKKKTVKIHWNIILKVVLVVLVLFSATDSNLLTSPLAVLILIMIGGYFIFDHGRKSKSSQKRVVILNKQLSDPIKMHIDNANDRMNRINKAIPIWFLLSLFYIIKIIFLRETGTLGYSFDRLMIIDNLWAYLIAIIFYLFAYFVITKSIREFKRRNYYLTLCLLWIFLIIPIVVIFVVFFGHFYNVLNTKYFQFYYRHHKGEFYLKLIYSLFSCLLFARVIWLLNELLRALEKAKILKKSERKA